MSSASVSVALCTYQGARHLEEQLQSIARQSRPPDELVACDDGSTDSTVPMLETFAGTVSFPVRIVRNARNLGSNRNFEQAIGLCGGTVIFLSDQDDVWRPEKISTMLTWLDEHPDSDAVFSDGDVVDDQSRPVGRTLWQSVGFDEDSRRLAARDGFHRFLESRYCVTGATLAFRSRLIERILPFPAHLAFTYHDAWIARVASVTGTLDSLPHRLIQYREHAAQQVGFRVTGPTTSERTPVARRERLKGKYVQSKALYEELLARCRGDTSRLEEYQDRLAHACHRAKLPASRLARLPRIVRELWRGGYSRPGVASLKQVIGDALL